MNKLILIGLMLAAVAVNGQGITTAYDKFKEQTRVSYRTEVTSLSVTFSFGHPGTTLRKDADSFYMFVHGGSRCSGFCFNRPALIFLVDDERRHFGTQHNGLSDSALYSLTRAELQWIADAKSVEFQVGRYEGKLKDDDLAGLKALLVAGTKK